MGERVCSLWKNEFVVCRRTSLLENEFEGEGVCGRTSLWKSEFVGERVCRRTSLRENEFV